MSFGHSARVLSETAGPAECQAEAEADASNAAANKIRVVIALSSELERMAWTLIVGRQHDMEMVAQVASGVEALAFLRSHNSDVTLIDEAALNSAQLQEFRDYCRRSCSSRFVLATLHSARESFELAGPAFIHSYILKGATADELLNAIRSAAVGKQILRSL